MPNFEILVHTVLTVAHTYSLYKNKKVAKQQSIATTSYVFHRSRRQKLHLIVGYIKGTNETVDALTNLINTSVKLRAAVPFVLENRIL